MAIMQLPRRAAAAIAAGVLAALTGAPRAALAQNMMSITVLDERSTFAPDLTRGDLEVFARVLGLSDEERRAMQDLYGAYAATLAAEGREVRAFCADLIERAELVEDQRILQPARERMDVWRERAEQLKATFLDDLRVLLTSEQEARWPILERELRRLKRVSAGRLPGEAVDLIRILGATPGAEGPATSLAEVLERYSGDLDRALVARDRLLDEHKDGFSDLITEDPPRALELFERARGLRVAIREVNVRYTRLIAAELPPGVAEPFARRVLEASYPELASPSRGERYIRAAGELGSLTSEQAATVREVIAAYDASRWSLMERMAKEAWELRLAQIPPSLEHALNPSPDGEYRGFAALGLGRDHPLTALRLERFELDKATRAKIDAVLSPEQRRALPDTALGEVVFKEWPVWGL